MMSFPADFVWGTATSSYQVEGAAQEDGRGPSIWDAFSRTPSKVKNGDTGDVACDHYHRFPQDIALMRDLGVNGYRFSVAWPRVLPQGVGRINEAGLDFYKRLVDALREAGIEPYLTLYHWDLPQALQERGGWENPDSVAWFSEYSHVVSSALGADIGHWITLNEPFVISMVANLMGVHAPGKRDPVAAYTIAHHLMLAHGASVPIVRANAPGAEVGITLDQTYSDPLTSSDADRRAARRFAAFHNDWFLEPVFRGVYPADLLARLEPQGVLARVDLSQIERARVPIDFLGVNYYTRSLVRDNPGEPLLGLDFGRNEHGQHTALDWEVYPDGLLHTLLYLRNAYYPAKIYITENGCAYDDPQPSNGVVEDPERARYYQLHLNAVAEAIRLGVPVAGYFAWSMFDNFEWAEGYDKRFGIYHVDFATQQRTPKRSALAYRDRIAAERTR